MGTSRHFFLNHLAQTTKEPLMLEFARAEGVYMYDLEDTPYLDLISGISVSNLGHGNPKIVSAIQQQAGKNLHLMVYGEYIQRPQTELAKKLATLLPKSLDSVYLLNSGSEANECALKLAKRVTKRSKIVAFKHAYHGSTHGVLSLMSNEYYSANYRPLLPNVYFAEFNQEKSLDIIDEDTACVIVEPVQSEAGIIPGTPSFLKALRAQCSKVGALLIFDEIQTGMGRTGSMFAFEEYGVIPDILTLGKAFGGGMPLSACISSKELMDHFSENPILGHITTFGGHPVCCAAALASLDILSNSTYISEVKEKEMLVHNYFKDHPHVKSVRGAGLLIGIEFENMNKAMDVIRKTIEKKVLVDWFLYNQNTMRIAPPLSITSVELKNACSIIASCI